jgi:hypothetical protein
MWMSANVASPPRIIIPGLVLQHQYQPIECLPQYLVEALPTDDGKVG